MEDKDTTAREVHHCTELNLNGQPCGSRPVAGGERCYIHGIYRALNDGRSTIDIPLLEDPKAILYVYSQVARALSQGAMPAANANGIIRCCKGAQRLLEEQWKRERFEERRKKAEDRNQQSEKADPLAKDQHDHADGIVPSNSDNSETAGNVAEPAAISATLPAPDDNDAGDQTNTLQAASCAGHEPGDDSEPRPWNVDPPLPIVAPPQFADAPEKFKFAVERVGSQHLDALLRRDRAIRARGGSMSDFYEKRGQGVRCDVRDTYL